MIINNDNDDDDGDSTVSIYMTIYMTRRDTRDAKQIIFECNVENVM